MPASLVRYDHGQCDGLSGSIMIIMVVERPVSLVRYEHGSVMVCQEAS